MHVPVYFVGHGPCTDRAPVMVNKADRSRLVRPQAPVHEDWDGVSRTDPCPMCGADSGCSRHVEAAFVSCARRPSDWPLTNGTWLHRSTMSAKTEPTSHADPGGMPPVSQDAARLPPDDHGWLGALATVRTLR